jgi:hypothetical protein
MRGLFPSQDCFFTLVEALMCGEQALVGRALSKLAFVATFSRVESYWDSPSKCFMHVAARERMTSIPVLTKIIARFSHTDQPERICEVLWVISPSESVDVKRLFMRLFIQVIASTGPQCQEMTEFLLSLLEAKPGHALSLAQRADGKADRPHDRWTRTWALRELAPLNWQAGSRFLRVLA